MARRFDGTTLVIASHNAGKVREFGALLRLYVADLRAAAALGLPEPDETGNTFEENARIKAGAAARTAGLPALADDSGLVVPALGGAPGIHSARWAGAGRDFGIAMERVRQELGGAGGHAASFVCVLALGWADGHLESFEGRVSGTLVWPPRGDRGFGYDPMFLPNGHALTFAEMDPDAKHAISHRADAFRKLVAACFDG